MKVAVVIERYDVCLGGAEWLVFELVSALCQLGIDVEVLAANANDAATNARILCQGSSGKRISLALFAKIVRQYLDGNRFDLVHSVIPLTFADVYQPPGGSYVEAVIRNAASYQSKFMTSYKKATAFTNRRRTEALHAEKELCKNPHGPTIAALSEYVKEQFKAHYGLEDARMVVIPNGVNTDRQIDTARVRKLRSEIFGSLQIGQTTNPVFLLFAANNFRLKGLCVLIEALAILTKKACEKSQVRPEHSQGMGLVHTREARFLDSSGEPDSLGMTIQPFHTGSRSDVPSVPYLIVAGNDRPHKYRQLARRLGIADRVVFLGFLSDIQNALAISDVAVLPTFYDPSSRFILEAIAAGKPVITTRFNGATDLFTDDRHGKVIDSPENTWELARAISHFADRANIQKASQAIVADNLRERVSITRLARQLVSVYESILERKGRHSCTQSSLLQSL